MSGPTARWQDLLEGYRGELVTTCCGESTIVDSVQLEVRALPEPPATSCRFVTLSRWQCRRVQAHAGGASVFTDVELPRRTD